MSMTNHSRLPFAESPAKGFRLQSVELLNWGTFDGQIYRACPAGNSALVIGRNESGKSTLVDALLTLLVRPGVRNFNVAAGAKKRERDEKSYLLGAYNRSSDDDGQTIRVRHLRPKGDHYSVILASFRNDDIGKAFTLAQVRYLDSDQTVRQVYCFADDERSIQNDFAQLENSELIVKTLKERGFRATRTFQEYEGWFTKTTHVKAKAMEVFNQTVAVKDIVKLNDFIRDHMLEAHDWTDKVDRLLGHFTQLSEAHDSLVRVRQQRDLLAPVARIGSDYLGRQGELDQAERLLKASGAWFSQCTIDLFGPAIKTKEDECAVVRKHRESLAREIDRLRQNYHSLQNQIDHVGGDRLKEILHLIQLEQTHADNKRQRSLLLHAALAQLGWNTPINDAGELGRMQAGLPSLKVDLHLEEKEIKEQRNDTVLERGQVRQQLSLLGDELTGLERRRENIPEWCVQLRQNVCQQLGLDIRNLPFAAELVQVHPDEREWESSIEKVLHGLALSLLVPDRFYSLVAAHVERTRLSACGRGQRLVYLRVAQQTSIRPGFSPGRQSLLRKLVFRDGHSLLPWLKAELSERFDYTCCETVEEFQTCRGLAMTRHRHVKTGGQRHEKDDRDHVIDPRNFVLGWDNRDKKQRLSQAIASLLETDESLSGKLQGLEARESACRTKLAAIENVLTVTDYIEIDFDGHQQEIQRLKEERRAIESQSDELRTLKDRLKQTEESLRTREKRNEELIGDERELNNLISDAKKLVSNAQSDIQKREADGSLDRHRTSFDEMNAEFVDPPLTTETLFDRERQWRDVQDQRISDLRVQIEPIRNRLTDAMSKFLRICPEESADLRTSTDYLESFLELQKRILEDDLPRHEQRFKERLNQKVIEEIGLFRSALEQERRGIEDKIELLNVSLKKLEYRPDMHIQLQPRAIRDAEITDFQSRLRECVEGSFEDSAEANEARFERIKELIIRLRDDETRRWRDKVTDVRRWFDFVAAVINRHTQETESFYQDSSGQSGGEKAKLAFTILVAAIAYQYDLDPEHPVSDRFHFVVVDEMFSKMDDQHSEYALDLFQQFGLQLLIVAPLDAKARVTQPYVGCYLHVVKRENRSAIYEMTATEFDALAATEPADAAKRRTPPK